MFWETTTAYEFGPYRLDTKERQLLRNGQVVPLRPKVFDVLLALVQNSGHILSKDEVMKIVWPNTAVEEGNLARNISTLRSVLGEPARAGRYIETIPWRGYRFVASVRKMQDSTGPALQSLAVLPFVNVGADPKRDYLADGITEGLITKMAQLTNLRVTSRHSTFRYRGRETDAPTVGRELRVQAILTGRVAESEDMLSISVELIEAGNDRHIWGAQYIRRPDELFAAQDTIAHEIVARLRVEVSSGQEQRLVKRHTDSPDAYLLFLKGRYHFNKLTPEGVQRSLEYFAQAIALDPVYALAFAARADAHNYLAQRDESRQALRRALELDETLGEAHASLGFFKFLYEWDFAGAEAEFKRALALAPNYAEAHHWYAIYLANLGRHEEAFREAEIAVERDPLSLLMNMTAALNFYTGREYDRAIAQLKKVFELDRHFLAAHSVLGCVYVQQQKFPAALAEFASVLDLVGDAPQAAASVKVLMAQAFARWGNRDEALRLLAEVAAAPASPYSVAGVYAALGEIDQAYDLLHQALLEHDLQLVSLKVDPALDGTRTDPRFPRLVRQVGLPD